MSKPVSNLRLFVAVYPTPEAARDMRNTLRKLSLPAHRETPMEQIHLTLQFIGDTPSSELDDVIESVERSAAGVQRFTLTPRGLIALPHKGHARLIACETDSPPSLMEIHRRLVTRLARSKRDRADERFLPHFTLCRFRSPAANVSLETKRVIEPFPIDRIVLMRSVLKPEGAAHVMIAGAALE